MPKSTITPLLLLLFTSTYAQNIGFDVHGKYEHAIKKEKLDMAQSMADIIPYYPANWITTYVSVEISATCNGKAMTASSANDTLSFDQKNILQTLDPGSDLVINIAYQRKNTVTDALDLSNLHYSATLVPDIEAEYPGGHEQMTQYLKANAIDKIPETNATQLQQAVVNFTVSETGKIVNAQISQTSGDPNTDKILLKAIHKMPTWKPAENANGIKVKQDFKFVVGNPGC